MKGERTLKVGIVGAGTVVRTLHAPLLKQFPDVSIEWVCDIRRDAARWVADACGIPTAHDDLARCGDVDAVLLAIPVGARAGAWQAAAERRWHVLCEKPAARTVRELDSILQRMHEVGRCVSFGYMRRFYQGTLCLRRLIAENVFGEAIEMWAGEGGPQTRTGRGDDWYQLDRNLSGGGILIETGSHLLDQLLFAADASGCVLEDYVQRTWQDDLEFDARVVGRVRAGARLDVPFSCVVTRSADVCNGLFVRYPQVTIALPPGPASRVELRDRRNRPIGSLDGADAGSTTSFAAFRDEWTAFLRQCREPEPVRLLDEHRLTRLSVGLIEDCYARAACGGLAGQAERTLC